MSFPSWLIDDASCGTSNPVSGLMKQLAQDKFLQRDRFNSDQLNEGTSKKAHKHEYEKFFNQPGREPDVYDLDQMGKELRTIIHDTKDNENWVHNFLDQPNLINDDPLSHNVAFEKIFNDANCQDEWINMYLSTNQNPCRLPSDEYTAFESAFHDANKNVDWESEFNAIEQSNFISQDKSWTNEFQQQNISQDKSWTNEFQQQNDDESNKSNAKAELAKSAGKLIESIKDETNPKFQNSSFIKFMKQLRDNEVSIEGNKVVEQKFPVSNADWVSEFSAQNQNSWASEFNLNTSEGDGEDWGEMQKGLRVSSM
ncbi:23408_t:CDS:2 [Cetraspora pellucida]|uniref:23408_t:CDS:1 n=1 Tax=Cetraspora pellucida TaxID=1433469 RepID=A0A9N8WIL5_9GLOM|nr:23408_t:CDS:2 [Cetraspora pellucida]